MPDSNWEPSQDDVHLGNIARQLRDLQERVAALEAKDAPKPKERKPKDAE